ncbi:trypsin-like peptidase domain-containing protein [bacterium]|nr:trypsin-like peptidase domain-containing protein [bacterium]
MKLSKLALALVSLFSLSANGQGKLLEDEKNNIEVYEKCSPAVVNITATTLRRDFFFDVIPQKGAGSGVVIRADGYIVTNDHVVGDAAKVEVTFTDKTTLPAKVVGTDPDSDIAVLKVEKPKLSAVDYGLYPLKVGQKVLAIGNPFGYGGSLSTGIISSLGRDIRTQTDRLVRDIIQTDAAINPGNSGGPLLDSSGKLIGINTQIISPSGANSGVGFAISVQTVKRVVEQLILYGQVLRPDLGMFGVGYSAALLQTLRLPLENGVMITELDPQGLAAKAGLKAANQEAVVGFRRFPFGGDIIFSIDDKPVTNWREVQDLIFDKKVGEQITVHFLRGKTKRSVVITLRLPDSVRPKSL